MHLNKLRMVMLIATVATAFDQFSVTSSAMAFSLTGLDRQNNLVFFDSSTPGTIANTVAVTGLQSGEALLGIDYRPATGQLFGIGSSSRVYALDTTTGAATAIGATPFSPGLSGTAFGVDFNPVPDLIRVVSNGGQNLRLSPVTGQQAPNSPDTPLAYDAGDINANQPANIVASAYANNVAGVTATTLYSIDSVLNVLVRQGGLDFPANPPSPNTGRLFTVGSLGIDVGTNLVAFDIFTDNDVDYGIASIGSNLYSVDLNTGRANRIGGIGNNTSLRGVSAAAVPEPTTMAGLAIAGAGMALARRRQQSRKA